MSKIKDNLPPLLPKVKEIILDLLRFIFSKNLFGEINNNLKKYYINHVNINILYIISIAYVIYCFFMQDIFFICIFILLFVFIYFFKNRDSIIYIFPLLVCNIIYEIFLKNNTYFKKLTKRVYIEGYDSTRAIKWRGWDKSTIQDGGKNKEKLKQDMENQDEQEPANKDDPLEGGDDLDADGDGDKMLEKEDEDGDGADENNEEENIRKVNAAASKGKSVGRLMSKRLK